MAPKAGATDHDTAVFVVPVTEAEKAWLFNGPRAVLPGVTEIATAVTVTLALAETPLYVAVTPTA